MSAAANPDRVKKWKNWWYYYKWYVVCGTILLGIIIHLTGNALGLWGSSPDFQIAYVGMMPLTEDEASALKQVFASIGEDFDGDGEVLVELNQYISGIPNADAETAYYQYADEISMIGDISGCESYFFLADDPENLQREYQILANFDGSCPDDRDYSAEGKVIAWDECPLLSEALEEARETLALSGETAEEALDIDEELFSRLYLGRRCFYTDAVTAHAEQCEALWDRIYESFE